MQQLLPGADAILQRAQLHAARTREGTRGPIRAALARNDLDRCVRSVLSPPAFARPDPKVQWVVVVVRILLMFYLLASDRRIRASSELGGKELQAAFSRTCGVAGDVSTRRLEVRIQDRVPLEPRG